MAIYKSFTGDQTNIVLIAKGGRNNGNVNKILITNTHPSNVLKVTLDLHDGTNTFNIVKLIQVPTSVSLLLDENIRFDSNIYNLRITTTNSANCDLIIK